MGLREIEPGEILGGTFLIERLIGEGSSGLVYSARHLGWDRRVALKILLSPEGKVPDAEMLARFRREAKITSRIGHPNIIKLFDFVQPRGGPPYIVMELLAGESLERRIRRVSRLSLPATTTILRQLTSALQAAHDLGVVHRDLKPSNVYLCPAAGGQERVKLLDFGLSKLISSDLSSTVDLTRENEILGTPLYMSPEQVLGHTARSTPQTDIFTTGVLLYLMLTGRVPFLGETAQVVFSKITRDNPPPMRACGAAVSQQVEAVILKALSKRPELRQGSMNELFQEFEAALSV